MMMKQVITERESFREVRILKGRVISLAGFPDVAKVICVCGMVWLTKDNDIHDHILTRDTSQDIDGNGLVVLEGLADSIVRLLP